TLAVPASTCASLVTSMTTPMARLPAGSISRAVASAAAWLRSAIATLAPSRANTIAISLPIPLAAPVMMATLSCKRIANSFRKQSQISSQVVVHDLAEAERQVRDDVCSRNNLEHRQFGQWSESVGEQGESSRSGPRSFEVDVQQLVFDQLANAWRAI